MSWLQRLHLVRLGDIDPIQHLGDPDETPIADETGPPVVIGDPDDTPAPPARLASEDARAVVERLDVPPQIRPWDVAREPSAAPSGPAAASPAEVECPQCRDAIRANRAARDPHETPHCDGRHGDGHPTKLGTTRCEYCDALTGAITLVRSLEKRVAELERQVAELVDAADQRDEYEREMRERQS